jgi:transposase
MLTIGVDAHKSVNHALAVDEVGRPVADWRGVNTPAGWAELRVWAVSLGGDERQWGIEGTGSYGWGLAQCLVRASETVYDVNPRWTAVGRRGARQRDKTDAHDARAIAEVVRREFESLSPLKCADKTAVLAVLVEQREGALAEATRLRNQIHALLHHLDPGYKSRLPVLASPAGVAAAIRFAITGADPLQQARAAAVRCLAQRLRLASQQAEELAAQIAAHAVPFTPLTAICGINLLSAGALAGLLGPGQRFNNEAQLAAYAGVAPIEASSGERVRHRLNRGGNPSAQLDPASRRRHTGPMQPVSTAVPGATHCTGENQARGSQSPETLHRSRCMAPVAALLEP